MTYNIFGSKDSLDYDVMFQVDRIPETKQECKSLCSSLEGQFPRQDKPVNGNICVTHGKNIVQVYKGTPDECNNAVFLTYGNHNQDSPCLVTSRVDRDIPLKVDRSLRIVLSFLSRTEYRKIVKTALKSPEASKRENCINCLRAINFEHIKSFGTKNGEPLDITKQIAFQVGQTVGLLRNKELYTKGDIKTMYPPLSPFLDRQEYSLDPLQRFKTIYLYEISLWRNFNSPDPNGWSDNA